MAGVRDGGQLCVFPLDGRGQQRALPPQKRYVFRAHWLPGDYVYILCFLWGWFGEVVESIVIDRWPASFSLDQKADSKAGRVGLVGAALVLCMQYG